nr:integrase, catalytic core [Tanacetum cinerariifolium]
STMSDNPWLHHIRFIEFDPSSSVVPTYRQDEDDQDAQHQEIPGDNPTIIKPIHFEYSLDDNSKPETPIVIEEDEKLTFEITTKLHKVPTEDNSIMPEEETSKDSPLKEIQHQIVPVSRYKSDNMMSLSRHCISHYPMVQIEGMSGLIMADTRKARHLSTYNKIRNKENKKHVWSTTIPPDKLEKRNFIGIGRCKGGLYKMKMTRERSAMATTIETWHKRLGHASKGKLARVDFLITSINNLDSFCDPCARAKHTRLPFPTSLIKNKAPFELIHCDIWGGYRIPSYTKSNYFLTIVDDFSRAIWIFLLKQKNEASQQLQNFHKMIEVQFEKGIKRIRCDNGGEFISNKMLEFYNEKRIFLETTCPHTPQQNGVVERKHRHLENWCKPSQEILGRMHIDCSLCNQSTPIQSHKK